MLISRVSVCCGDRGITEGLKLGGISNCYQKVNGDLSSPTLNDFQGEVDQYVIPITELSQILRQRSRANSRICATAIVDGRL